MNINVPCCIFNLLLVTLLVSGTPVPTRPSGKHVFCYFEAISAKKPHPEVRFLPEDIDLTICTHVVYNRAIVGGDLEVMPKDSQVDLRENDGLGLFHRTVALKDRKPGLKVILDLHDINAALRDAAVDKDQERLSAFAKNVVDFVQSNGFDGVNFRVRNHEGFVNIVPVLHEELAAKGILLMTFYLPLNPSYNKEYEMTEALSRSFDLIVLGSYWQLPRQYTNIFSSVVELEKAVDEFAAEGIPAEKLVVPIPAFSASLKLCGPEENGLNSTICDAGDEGIYESTEMILYSSQLLRKISNSTEGWVVRRDPESKVSYGYSKTLQWVSFEDPESVRSKAQVILERNLAGAAIMNIDMEDFKGAYTENGETYPLARAAFQALHGESQGEK